MAEDIAALEAVAEYWETHYNLGHAGMVASKMLETGLMWSGDGTMMFGREAIEANLAAQIESGSPKVEITQDETLIFGNEGVARGTYRVAGSADDQEFTNTGYWLSLAEKVDGEWQIRGLVSNLDSPDQPIVAGESMELPEVNENASLLAERAEYYMTHFNLGHPDMVADTYTEDAISMTANEAVRSGRAAILERLTGMTDAGAKVTVTPWGARELDGGAYVAGVGTYEVAVPDQETVTGHFHDLYKDVDG